MSFKEMSYTFQRAFGLGSAKRYQEAIKLYEEDLKENPENIASMNKIAVAKIHIALSEESKEELRQEKGYLEKALKIVDESDVYKKSGYPIAEANLNWVNELLKK